MTTPTERRKATLAKLREKIGLPAIETPPPSPEPEAPDQFYHVRPLGNGWAVCFGLPDAPEIARERNRGDSTTVIIESSHETQAEAQRRADTLNQP